MLALAIYAGAMTSVAFCSAFAVMRLSARVDEAKARERYALKQCAAAVAQRDAHAAISEALWNVALELWKDKEGTA